MSCTSCAAQTLKTFLGRFDITVLPTGITGRGTYAAPTITARGLRNFASKIPCHSVQRRSFQHKSSDTRASPVDERSGKNKPGRDNGHFDGIGHAGQQRADLQEQLSSIAAASESSLRSAKASGRKPSSEARLARRERRRPGRRFNGDRTRPETKEKTTASRRLNGDRARPEAKEKTTASRRFNGDRTRPEAKEKTTVRVAGRGGEERSPGPLRNTARFASRGEEERSSGPWRKTAWNKGDTPLREPSEARTPVRETEGVRAPIEPWGIQKRALEKKFGEQGWQPRKRLSPDALEGIRALHAQHPDTYTTPELAHHFKVSPENIRRILKSKWRPNEEEDEDRRRRWEKRGEGIWKDMAAKGVKPPKPWREKGIGRLSERRDKSPSFASLEEQIGTEDKVWDITTTRTVGENLMDRSLENTIL